LVVQQRWAANRRSDNGRRLSAFAKRSPANVTGNLRSPLGRGSYIGETISSMP